MTTSATSQATEHFERRLAFETDAADVWSAIQAGSPGFTLVDARSPGAYAKAHLPGAVNLPHAEIDEQTAAELPDGPLVTYCWGPGCNAATKAAAKLAALGRPVKEMIGGFEYWVREGSPVEGRGKAPGAYAPDTSGLVG
ncbi:MAG TPA: rhodanese-like domain-containing protein [Thermoleophilaceae bacterium]|nr:rhodanese-like domain-containing protein [Thermoleophilaceae bacterium]